ncbi:Blp family class II bacteriocin [uncultured Psychrosphaera sp.]|uniref:Blp family class II bacteriocin n=1 Tax=uncultured Psychrosphaera sp. TaxID=1403522 RepID=UPI00262F6D7B|nr:Blp family class II bacteriocin [uncultured Psychrosphaera sp.]
MHELNVNEVQEVNGGTYNPWTTPNPNSGQSCINEMVEQGGIGAIGGALGGGITSLVGAIFGAFNAFVNSDECEGARE